MQIISRADAKAQGRRHYFTGKPCKHGHVAERFVSCHACTTCHEVSRAAFNARNPAYDQKRAIAYRQRNPDRARKACRRWALANPRRNNVSSIVSRGARRGFEVDADHLLALPCPEICPVLSTPIAFVAGQGHRATENVASFDRIDSSLGYVKGNVQIVSLKANQMKSNATPEELVAFAKWVLTTYKDVTNGRLPT
jgi:hypothetical protein